MGMGRVATAFQAFFRSLFDAATALRVQEVLRNTVVPPAETPSLPAPQQPPVVPKKSLQSEAITLLATLQREARLVDFLKEDLSQYSDEQVGAAVREIHRESASVLDRFFAIRSVLSDDEGATVNVPAGFDAGQFRLTGKLSGSAPYRGTLRHHGWEATQCDLPMFSGTESAAKIIAPAEVEVS
jgi:hypothetical protein